MSEKVLDPAYVEGLTVDLQSGKQIRETDNGLRELDLDPADLNISSKDLDEAGLPRGWEVPNGNS